MSIVTLKRKSEARYFPHSVNGVGFSLNGTTRFLGIGASLGRSVTRTPFRGTAPVGHGGNNSQYETNIIRSCVPTPQTLVKPPVINYRMKYKIDENQCCQRNWVKQSGSLATSDLLRNCVVDTTNGPAVPKKDKQLTTPPCTNTPVVYTKSAPGPDPYDLFYRKKVWNTRACAVPSWPPRVLNSFCAPVYFRPTNSQ